jgi:hypothetical protein
MNTSQGKKGHESTGKLVVIQIQQLQIRQLAQFSRNGTWGIQNTVKTYKNKSRYPTGTIGLTQGKSPTSYATQIKERGEEYR